MTRHRSDLTKGSILPSTWVNSLMEFVSTTSANIVLDSPSTTTIRANAGTGNAQMSLGISGRWRYRSTSVTATHPGGAAGSYDLFATATDNDFSAADPSDSTDYTFGLVIPALAGTPVTALYRKIGVVRWDGAAIVGYELNLTDGANMMTRLKDGIFIGPSGTYDTNLYRSAADTLRTDDAFIVGGDMRVGGKTGLTTYTANGNFFAAAGGLGANVSGVGQSLLIGTVTGDTVPRFNVIGSGAIAWGDGGSTADTTLYRSAADTLRTDDSLIVATNLTVNGNTRLGSNDGNTLGFFSVTGAARATGPTQTRVTGITFTGGVTTFPPALSSASTLNDLIGTVSRIANVLQAHGLLGTGGTWAT